MDQARKLLSALNVRQLITIAICAAAVVGGVVWFSRYQHESGMRPLYSSLSPEDASAIVQKLRETGVDYKIADNGASVLVPEARIPELRLEMAGLGLPKTGRIGFEIFDKTNFGMTDFAEHVNYRRAVEGELERSVRALAEVQQARVHVTLPKESVFTDSREAAKASVLVGLRPGTRLSAQNVLAIRNLVASAVEGLTPELVSVVDMNGNLLSQPRRNSLDEGVQVTEAALEYRQAVEHDLALKINNTLEPLLGADKFRTGVSADVDMTSGEESEESFDPSKSVMLTSQKTEDTNGSTRPGPVAPGTAANLPPMTIAAAPTPVPPPAPAPAQNQQTATTAGSPAGAASAATADPPKQAAARPAGTTTNSSRRTESITYQSSRTVKHVKMPQGSIKKLSIAVLVDQGTKLEGQGKQMHRVVLPPDPDKLKAIQSLVGALVGFSTERGDQLTVEALPFDASLNLDVPMENAPAPKKTDETFSVETLKKKPAILYGAGGGVVLLLLLAFFAFGRRKSEAAIPVQVALPAPAPQAMLSPVAGAAGIAPPATNLPALMPTKSELLLAQLQDNAKKDPEAWAGVVRGWLAEERT
ncbi:MAG TPA: flagellar basal-body MS-ring/collar protein FliF [Bryobacteraceae bacterium]|nr:flagellar basal-body MS-ring/collar protein FliF [Bryobacteraceae bacterium]